MRLSRRSFIKGAAAGGSGLAGEDAVGLGRRLWSRERERHRHGAPRRGPRRLWSEPGDDSPQNLPGGVAPYRQEYRNWAGDIVTEPLWTVDVTSEEHVVAVVNWAAANGYRVRPKGFSHNWSPLTVADGEDTRKVLLLDTRQGLTAIRSAPDAVVVGAGASMDALLTQLDAMDRGLAHCPALGDVTVGGVLAIGGHGAAVPGFGETLAPGHSYGSLSNLVLSLRAVVWDKASGRYQATRFDRTDYDIGALLVHLGRAFITEVTLRVGPRQTMRCESFVDVPMAELAAAPGTAGRTVSHYLDLTGRLEIIWLPFTERPWLKTWRVTSPLRVPDGSRAVSGPYNYPFADAGAALDEGVRLVYQDPANGVAFAQGQAAGIEAGLAATATADLWGNASYLLRYVLPSTVRVTANGYAILCARRDVQWVVHEVYSQFQQLLSEYTARGEYPVNGPMEIRVTGLDDPADCAVPRAQDPWLSPTRRRPDHPEWDCAVYLDLLTLPFTAGRNPFYTEFERWLFAAFTGNRSSVRVEWSKGWAYTSQGAFTDTRLIGQTIPASLSQGQHRRTTFEAALEVLTRLDPYRIYSSPLLDRLAP
ncbi:MAG: cholesterol oxidase substrate-binding domain-containing protein [Actinomycetales bacterium]